jgi:hypothetical protein
MEVKIKKFWIGGGIMISLKKSLIKKSEMSENQLKTLIEMEKKRISFM